MIIDSDTCLVGIETGDANYPLIVRVYRKSVQVHVYVLRNGVIAIDYGSRSRLYSSVEKTPKWIRDCL